MAGAFRSSLCARCHNEVIIDNERARQRTLNGEAKPVCQYGWSLHFNKCGLFEPRGNREIRRVSCLAEAINEDRTRLNSHLDKNIECPSDAVEIRRT